MKIQPLKENYPKLILILRLIVKLKKLEEVLREESNNFELLKIENEETKLMKMLGKGPIIGIKTFPRPYCEIGNNIKVLRRRVELLNYDIGDVEFVKAVDLKYSGKTSQLIIDYPWKKEQLTKILNNDYKNLEGINFEDTMKLVDDVYETKTFLKSKNISSKLRKKKKHIQRKMRVVNDEWNYFSKIYCIEKNNQIKKILFIQKFLFKYLWRIHYIKKENAKPENKIKIFNNLFVKCLIKHARKFVFPIFFKKKKKKIILKKISVESFKKIYQDGIKDLKNEKLRIETIPILEQKIKNHEIDLPIIKEKEKNVEKAMVKPNVRILEDMFVKNKNEKKESKNLKEKRKFFTRSSLGILDQKILKKFREKKEKEFRERELKEKEKKEKESKEKLKKEKDLNEKNKLEIKFKDNIEEQEKKEKNIEKKENKLKVRVIKIVGKKENENKKEKKSKEKEKKDKNELNEKEKKDKNELNEKEKKDKIELNEKEKKDKNELNEKEKELKEKDKEENELKEKIKKEKKEIKIKVKIKNENKVKERENNKKENKFKEKELKEKELIEKESKEKELKEREKKENKLYRKKNSDIIVKTEFINKNISSPDLLIEQSKKEVNNKKIKDRIKIDVLFYQKKNDNDKKKRYFSQTNLILSNNILDERKNE